MEKIPTIEKKIFLRKKGLSEDMVDQAFKRFEENEKKKEEERKEREREKEK